MRRRPSAQLSHCYYVVSSLSDLTAAQSFEMRSALVTVWTCQELCSPVHLRHFRLQKGADYAVETSGPWSAIHSTFLMYLSVEALSLLSYTPDHHLSIYFGCSVGHHLGISPGVHLSSWEKPNLYQFHIKRESLLATKALPPKYSNFLENKGN